MIQGSSSDSAISKHMDWFNHAHAEFLKSDDNKYFRYADHVEQLEAKGKSRAKCHQDHTTGATNTEIGDCDGTDTASLCKDGHRGTTPVSGHCDESQTKHPSAVPTPAPTAIGHDGWGGLKFDSITHRKGEAADMEDTSSVLKDLAAISNSEGESAQAQTLNKESLTLKEGGAALVAQDLRMV